MDLFSLKVIKNLLRNYGVFPSKRLGQNFLIDKLVLLKIIKTANLQPNDVVLEIGPGIGNLTQEIAKRAKKVITIEKDSKMVEILKETTKNLKNLKIIRANILKVPNYQLPIANYKVVANLPYYIVSPVIRKFLEREKKPREMILMVQKEVAQRICASPAKVFASQKFRRARPPKMSLLAVSVQFYAHPEIVSFVSKKSFWPQPKVDGAILKIIPNKTIQKTSGRLFFVKKENKDLFFRIVKAGFSQPRKQLVNNLSKGLAQSSPNGLKLNKEKVRIWLLKNNIQPSQRAETLILENWISLTRDFNFSQ